MLHLQARGFLRYHSSSAAKSLLATLRRRSGFPIVKCKEALTRHNDDLEAAEKWLNEQALSEGWTKAAKVQSREAKQGLVGVAVHGDRAAMIELNCETDFVARTEKFQKLLSALSRSALEQLAPKLLTTTSLPSLDNHTVNNIAALVDAETEKTMADITVETVGHLQEKLVIARGCTMRCSSGLIFGHAYNSQTLGEDSVHMGKYGALLHMSTEPSNSEVDVAELRLLGDRICQHVIGLNPVGVEKEDEVEEDEVLANQPYLFNNSVTVGELMAEKGVSVTKFVRYALGEKEEGPFSLSS